jgi:Protein of Unknown function (DUF2784)
MGYSLLADLIVLLHFAFVLFVLFGGLLTVKWPLMIWIHGPALAWGSIVEFTGVGCPLTPLENRLRMRAGEAGYQGDFLNQWLLPVLYPEALTPDIQIVLGTLALALNVAIYTWIWRRRLIIPPR